LTGLSRRRCARAFLSGRRWQFRGLPDTRLLPCRRWSRRQRDTGQSDSILFQVGLEPELVPVPGLVMVLELVPVLAPELVLELELELGQVQEPEPALVWRRRQQLG